MRVVIAIILFLGFNAVVHKLTVIAAAIEALQ